MNDKLATELTSLWRAGAVELPQAAAEFAQAAAELHGTALREPAAFERSSGGTGELHPEWVKLRNTLQDRVLVTTHDRLLNAGAALTKVCETFAGQDETILAALNRFIEDIENGPEPARPPAGPSTAPSHTDAHPAVPQRTQSS
jgi:hypothetical protein